MLEKNLIYFLGLRKVIFQSGDPPLTLRGAAWLCGTQLHEKQEAGFSQSAPLLCDVPFVVTLRKSIVEDQVILLKNAWTDFDQT